MKKRALIITVGTGTRPDVYIVKPLVKTIENSRPDYLVMVATEGSRDHADAIARQIDLSPDSVRIAILPDFDNFQSVFKETNALFKLLLHMGYEQDEIQLDFTSGTKAMSSGAVLSAVYNQCGSIKYITGQRVNGVVADNTEQFRDIPPTAVFALYDLRLAEKFIRHLQFSAAEALLAGLRKDTALLDQEDRDMTESLFNISQAYRLWDAFDHAVALKIFYRIKGGSLILRPYDPSGTIIEQLQRIVKNSEESRYAQVIDLFNNAVRRQYEGRYDDAVARLYRVTEYCAQAILLQKYGIDSSDVVLEKIPPSHKETLESRRDDDGKIRIGMDWDYRLLAAFGDPAGLRYQEDESLQGLLRERNYSILAHGNKPITEKICRSLRKAIGELIETGFPGAMQESAALQFPWLQNVL